MSDRVSKLLKRKRLKFGFRESSHRSIYQYMKFICYRIIDLSEKERKNLSPKSGFKFCFDFDLICCHKKKKNRLFLTTSSPLSQTQYWLHAFLSKSIWPKDIWLIYKRDTLTNRLLCELSQPSIVAKCLWAKCLLAKCLLANWMSAMTVCQISVCQMSVCQMPVGQMSSVKCLSGKCLLAKCLWQMCVGQLSSSKMSVSQMSVSQMSVSQMSVDQMSL